MYSIRGGGNVVCDGNCFECRHSDCMVDGGEDPFSDAFDLEIYRERMGLPPRSERRRAPNVYYEAHRREVIERSKRYYQEHREQRIEYQKRRYRENREKLLEYQKARYHLKKRKEVELHGDKEA